MALKIFHTGDLHIGMKFNNYPDMIKNDLVEARFETLESMILEANDEQCNLFVISGDLFDKINIPKRDIIRVIGILEKFAGDCVLLIPGNHDYDNGMVELWEQFNANISGNILLLNEYKPYSLKNFDLDVLVYPAYCDSKHSDSNRINWINELDKLEEAKWQLGIAHGALVGLSPDLSNKYFNVSEAELNKLGLDLWLLGHTHLSYPLKKELSNRRVFNAGTPEPDGLDCQHQGTAWIIEIDDSDRKNITAKTIQTGKYNFKDLTYKVENQDDFTEIKEELLKGKPAKKIVRLSLSGRIEEWLFNEKEKVFQELRKGLAYLIIDDGDLKIRITEEVIDREFAENSFPHLVLKELAATQEEDSLQLAYEIIKEVKE